MATGTMKKSDSKPLLSSTDNESDTFDMVDGQTKKDSEAEDRVGTGRVRGFSARRPRCAKLIVPIEVTVTLYALCACAMNTLIEQLLYTKISQNHNVSSIVFQDRDDSKCSTNSSMNSHGNIYQPIQEDASYWLVCIKLARCLPALLVTMISGTISDRFSRKLPIVLPIAAAFFQSFILLMISFVDMPVWWFMVAALVDGLSGSIYTLMMGCYAYLGDSVVRENRAFKITLIECCRGLADVAAYIAAGYTVKFYGFTAPFATTSSLLLLCFLCTVCFLPSTSHNDTPNKADPHKCSIYAICDPCVFLKNVLRRKTRFLSFLCVVIMCCFIIGEFSRGGPQILYQQNIPFCWNAKIIGLYMAVQAFIHSIVMVFIVGLFQKRVGDVALVCLGAAGGAVSVFVQAFSVNTAMLFSVSVIGAFNILGYTLIKVVLSKLVTVNEQGKVFSLMAFLEITVDMLGTFILNTIYAQTLPVFRGLVFIIIALVYVFGFTLSMVLYFKYEKSAKTIEEDLELESKTSSSHHRME